jgi:hypothetical protein
MTNICPDISNDAFPSYRHTNNMCYLLIWKYWSQCSIPLWKKSKWPLVLYINMHFGSVAFLIFKFISTVFDQCLIHILNTLCYVSVNMVQFILVLVKSPQITGICCYGQQFSSNEISIYECIPHDSEDNSWEFFNHIERYLLKCCDIQFIFKKLYCIIFSRFPSWYIQQRYTFKPEQRHFLNTHMLFTCQETSQMLRMWSAWLNVNMIHSFFPFWFVFFIR